MKKPAILTIDVETSPQAGYFWGSKWETNIIDVTTHQQIMSFCAKWLDGRYVTLGQPDCSGYKKGKLDDRVLVYEIRDLLSSADIVVAQNGRDFDIKVINARMAFHGIKPPSPYKLVDTKVEAKKCLRLPSNSLDDLCAYFGIGRKLEHEGFALWTKCIAGDMRAWKKMLSYNKHDVELTEKLYLKLRPWMQTHPNIGVYVDRPVCPRCGSAKVQSRGEAVKNTTRYHRFQCQDCGKWCSDSKNIQVHKPLVAI